MSSSQPLFQYITREELAELIKSDKVSEVDYVVIDVRDSDYSGGNISGCVLSPSETFEDDLPYLLEGTKAVPKVIFHCALSQQRGPWAALRYARARKAEQEALEDIDQPSKNEAEEKKQEIFVLKGGFAEFQQVYKDDPDLVVNWSEEVWGEENWEEEVDRDDEVLELDD